MEIQLRFAKLTYRPYGAIVEFTFSPDEKFLDVHAVSHDTPHYYVIAHRLGYGDDVLAYCREHEFAHLFTQEYIYNRPSPVLLALARGKPMPEAHSVEEEALTQTFQRWMCANERPILSGVNWDLMKKEALAILDIGGWPYA